MEIPINLEKANSYLDACESFRFLCSNDTQARRAVRRFGQSERIVMTTAHFHGERSSRGGCIVLQSPRSIREARQWVRERGFGEKIDGFGHIEKPNSFYLSRRRMSSFRGAFPQPQSRLSTDKKMKFC